VISGNILFVISCNGLVCEKSAVDMIACKPTST